MILINDTKFSGAATGINAKKLAPGLGVNASDIDATHGDLRGLKAASTVHTLSGYGGTQQHSLYRGGRDSEDDAGPWFAYTDDVDFARSLLANDPDERTYATGTTIFTEPVYTDNTFWVSEPHGASGEGYALGIPAPASGMTAAINTSGEGSNQTRVYVSTFLRYNDDESAPSDPVTLICPQGSTVDLTDFPADPGASVGVDRRRIYVSTGGDFRLCVQDVLATATLTDTGTRGAILQTGGSTAKPTWLVPPVDMIGLVELWNGMHGGFEGKQYLVCVPYNPHAWPAEYRRQVPDTIVGTAKYGQTWVIATTGTPRLVEGRAPEGMQDRPINLPEACVSKRSVVGVGHGVCWASRRGLAYHGVRGTFLMTEGIVDPVDWAAMDPETIIAAHYRGWYVGFYNDGTRKGFAIHTERPQDGIIYLTQGAYAAFADSISGKLYILDTSNNIKVWEAGSVQTATFKSGNRRLARNTNPGAARIIATTYPVTFSMWADGSLKVNAKTVSNDNAFRLPAGYTCEELQYQVSGVGPIEAVLIGEEVVDL